ncbi:MAG TPA: hypothetical protein VMF52_17540 [Steroidobacteraceae bacterium]|nr:hypothetical protein [Steroidobacteraceae bacterium]
MIVADAGLDARRTKWGFALLLAGMGALLLFLSSGDAGTPVANRIFYGAAVLVGVGLMLNQPWARWLALGICFLYVIGAFLLPPLMFLARPYAGYDRALTTNLFFTAVALAFGGIGYRGLSYLRSEFGRFEYRRDRGSDEIPDDDGSWPVVLSAGVWVVFVLVMAMAGLRMPVWLLQPLDEDGTVVAPAPPPESAAPAPVITDIVPRGLCRGGDTLLAFAYEYRGDLPAGTPFGIRYNDSIWEPGSRSRDTAKLPARGDVATFGLGLVTRMAGEEGMNNVVTIQIDPEHRVERIDNRVKYAISWDIIRRLPACDAVTAVEKE